MSRVKIARSSANARQSIFNFPLRNMIGWLNFIIIIIIIVVVVVKEYLGMAKRSLLYGLPLDVGEATEGLENEL